MEYINKYLKILEIQDECIKLNEANLGNLFSKLTPETNTKSLLKQMESSINKRDPVTSIKRIKSLLSFLPTVKLKSVDSYIESKVKEYKNLKRMSRIVLTNSLPGISVEVQDYASSFLALSSFVVKKGQNINPKENLKKNLKEFIMKTRKFMDEQESDQENKKVAFQKEDLPDLAVAWTIVVMTTALGTALGLGGYAILTSIAGAIPWIIFVGLTFAVCWGIMQVV